MYLPRLVERLLREGKRTQAVKAIYKDYNKKSNEERVDNKNPMENWMLESINASGVLYQGRLFSNWEETTFEQDVYRKQDFVDHTGSEPIYCQIKYRQPKNNHGDILCCVIQPYPDNAEPARKWMRSNQVARGVFGWGRDVKFQGQIYGCLNKSWNKIRCLDYKKSIKPNLDRILKEFLESDLPLNTNVNTFRASWHDDFMLKCFPDGGKNGWDSGKLKVCAMLPDNLFDEGEIHWVDMIEPPDYLFEEVLS